MELMLLILLLGLSTADDLQLSGCSVTPEEGENVILPVNLNLTEDSKLVYSTITWKTETGNIVHHYWATQDYNKYQIERFKGRTSLFKEEINKGNFSLKIIKVTKHDEGNYICQVHHKDPDIDKIYHVFLCVTEKDEDPGGTETYLGDLIRPIIIGSVIGSIIGAIGGLSAGLIARSTGGFISTIITVFIFAALIIVAFILLSKKCK